MGGHSLLKHGTLLFIVCIALVILTSCTTTKYVPEPYPVPEVHEVHTTDTIREVYRDSTSVERSGDTVFVDRWHTSWRDRWHDSIVHDSIPYAVPEPYPVPEPYYDEKEMPFLKRTAMYIGYAAVVLIIIALIGRWKK